MKFTNLILIISIHFSVFAKDSDTFKLYFNYKNAQLSNIETRRLQKFINEIDKEAIKMIVFNGYTDTIGNEFYNQKLALNRILNVKNNLNLKTKYVIGVQKEDSEKKSETEKRRVELIVQFKKPSEYINKTQKFQYLNNDTVFVTQQKHKLIFKKNSFNSAEGNKINIEFEDLTSKNIMVLNEANTQTDKEILESASMFRIQLKNEHGEKIALNKEVTYKLNNIYDPTIKLFNGNLNSDSTLKNWELNENEKYKIENIADEVKEEVFLVVEEMPEYEGGMANMSNEISKKIKYPRNALNLGIQGNVIVTFIVNKEGKVENSEVIRGIGGGCDEEALRVTNSLDKWKTGKQNGENANVKFTIPIKFSIDDYQEGINYPDYSSDSLKKSINKNQIEINNSSNQKSINAIDNFLNTKSNFPISINEDFFIMLKGLNYINCDRFYSSKEKQIDFKVKVDTTDADNYSCKIIFNKINSVLNISVKRNKSYIFPQVPLNNEIVIIVSKQVRGFFYVKFIETNTNEKNIKVSNFEKMTTKAYVEKVLKLNL